MSGLGVTLNLLESSVRRGLRLLRTLLAVHLEVAEREARRDLSRLGAGAGLLVVGGVLLVLALLLVHGAAVAGLLQFLRWPWWAAFAAVAAVDGGLGAVLLFVGSRRVSQPLLPETRAMLERSKKALAEG